MDMAVIDYLCQGIITCTGMGSLYYMASQEASKRLLGGLIGLFGEPFWFATAWINSQYGVMVLVFVYGVAWSRVVYKNYAEVYGTYFDFKV